MKLEHYVRYTWEHSMARDIDIILTSLKGLCRQSARPPRQQRAQAAITPHQASDDLRVRTPVRSIVSW